MKKNLSAACIGALCTLATIAPAQNLFVSSFNQNAIYEITPGGVESTFATGITDPGPLAVNSAGDVFVQSLSSIIEVTPAGVKSTFATGLSDIGAMAFNSAGDLFVTDFNVQGSVYEITPGGVKSQFAVSLDQPRGLAINSAGDLFVTTVNNITEITLAGTESVFAPFSEGYTSSSQLAFNSGGFLFAEGLAIVGDAIIKISPTGTETSFAAVPVDSDEMAFNGAGNLFVAARNTDSILEINPNGGGSAFFTGISDPTGLAFAAPEPSVWGLLAASAPAWLFYRRSRIANLSRVCAQKHSSQTSQLR